jgi:hypothetical protein
MAKRKEVTTVMSSSGEASTIEVLTLDLDPYPVTINGRQRWIDMVLLPAIENAPMEIRHRLTEALARDCAIQMKRYRAWQKKQALMFHAVTNLAVPLLDRRPKLSKRAIANIIANRKSKIIDRRTGKEVVVVLPGADRVYRLLLAYIKGSKYRTSKK